MELWDVYDVDRTRTGKTMIRGEAFEKDAYHLVVHVCVFNRNHEMLIQKRQPFKSNFSGLWDVTVGGSAVQGDTSARAAERELFEEVGLSIDLMGVPPHLSVSFNHGFDDIYIVEKEVDPSALKLQYEEVEQVRFATEEEILSMIETGEFIPYYPQLIQMLFFMHRNGYGAHQK